MSLPSPIKSSMENDYEVLDQLKKDHVERMNKECRKLEKLEEELEEKWGIKREETPREAGEFNYNIGDKVEVTESGIIGKVIKIGGDQQNKGKNVFKIKGYEEMWFREDELISLS